MARYIAGFSSEARKSGPFCRPQATKPGAATRKYGVEELNFPGVLIQPKTAKTETGPGTGLQTTKLRRGCSLICQGLVFDLHGSAQEAFPTLWDRQLQRLDIHHA
jgi:hypothetical protein